ncbi:MAG: cysteine--tRNA ligase [Candidatus Limnocylindria bacterium]
MTMASDSRVRDRQAARFYNSLTRRVDDFRPIDPERVTIYTCGSTVYRYAHIGNLRTYLAADLLRRALEYLGYGVLHVKNITDVGHMRNEVTDSGEDRIEAAAEHEGKTPQDIAEFYTEAWFEDERALNLLPAHFFPKATDHITEMIDLTHRLLDRGLAYEVDGTVYYDVSEFPAYGKLSGQRLDQMRAGHRVEVETDKREPEDFALWKRAEPGRKMKWPSPWGEGFPGWHIECSAMSMKYLGERFDIHTGGIDLKFPHHEDEIAQSEGAVGHGVVGTWIHGEFLTLGDKKMAKSAGNIIRVTELPDVGFEPLDFRYLALTAHYRSKLDFTHGAMQAAAAGLRRLRRAAVDGGRPSGTDTGSSRDVHLTAPPMVAYRSRFAEAVANDLDMPQALAAAHAVARADDLTPAQRRALLLEFDAVLGLELGRAATLEPLSAEVQDLLRRRDDARRNRDYAASDALRDELAARGVEVRDTPEGQVAELRR